MGKDFSDFAERFVNHTIARLKEDKGLGARLRRADNSATEYQAWEYLSRFGVDLNDERKRRVFATVAAAIARAKPEKDGLQSLGRALCGVYPKESGKQEESSPAQPRLRRLLACGSAVEVCDVLRSILQLIESKNPDNVSYATLLTDLFFFNEKTRVRWAQDFFSYSDNSKDEPAVEMQEEPA